MTRTGGRRTKREKTTWGYFDQVNQPVTSFCSNLAGLVPSFEFETRRREMNKEYERELEKENEPVLCGKKKNKKAKKSKKNKKKNKKDDVEEEIIHVRIYSLFYIKELPFARR